MMRPVTVFFFVFFNKKLKNQMSFPRHVLLLIGLLSLFCYMINLWRYRTAMLRIDKRKGAALLIAVERHKTKCFSHESND
jgi:hypothetical protein